MNQLHQFYIHEEMRNAVKDFLYNHLKEITIKKAFNGEPTEGICEAKNTLSNAFKQLDDTYGAKPNTQAINSNE